MNMDVLVIGGGVIGCSILRELSRYDLRCVLVEKEEDVCSGTSKANSAIVHAGFDAKPGSLKAKMNVRGNEMMGKIAEDLDVDFKRNGSLVLLFDEADRPALNDLYEKGIANGVKDLRIVERDELKKLEPNISDRVVAALYAPTGGIICPFMLTVANAENAAANGAEFIFNKEITGIERVSDGEHAHHYKVTTKDKDVIEAKYVVNAAGVYADKIHNMVSDRKLHITPRAGEYELLDKEAGGMVKRTIFQLPSKMGKGILVTPTIHGNLLLGPTATDQDDKEGTGTTAVGLETVRDKSALSIKNIPYGKVITAFSGLRAHEDGGDFILGETEEGSGFFDAAGIESPGLTSAPAIGEYIAMLVAERAGAKKKENFIEKRNGIPHVAKLSKEERAALIKERPDYGVMVCRCEEISEGEIVDAIRRTPGARSLDGVKRRVRQGMGRCQAGFCTPRTMEILSREAGIPMEKICKNRKGSELLKEGY
ncbi:MAG: NAD(P)/FAD-dependent oxidoreductase [Eubacteriales bacterium]|nr:NAD(P)/FAD-dependent oxidoreductase [Eubacteriales bacterium]